MRADNRRFGPLNLAILRRTSEDDLDRGILRPRDLIVILVRHEDNRQRSISEGGNLRSTGIVTLRRNIHAMTPAPSLTIVVGDQRFQIESAKGGSLEDHHQRLATVVPSRCDAVHPITQRITVPMQTPRLSPGGTAVE